MGETLISVSSIGSKGLLFVNLKTLNIFIQSSLFHAKMITKYCAPITLKVSSKSIAYKTEKKLMEILLCKRKRFLFFAQKLSDLIMKLHIRERKKKRGVEIHLVIFKSA